MKRKLTETTSTGDKSSKPFVNLIVGGAYYSLLLRDFHTHQDCYFATVIKDAWRKSNDPIILDRNGDLFQHIFMYFYCARHNQPFSLNGSLSTFVGVRREADFYNLPRLVAWCDKFITVEMRKWCTAQPLHTLCGSYSMVSAQEGISELEALVNEEVYLGCCIGTHHLVDIDVTDSLRKSKPIVIPGKEENNKNMFQVSCYTTFFDSDSLLERLREKLPTLPGTECLLDNGDLFAITEGGFSHFGHIGAYSANHFGTIVFILNSHYTGGVITVTRNGVSKSITKPGEYIMNTSECTRDISTVTSGTLVFAKFSILKKMEIPEDFRGMLHRTEHVPYGPIQATREIFVHAVSRELNHVSSTGSVVLCLSDLYPIVEFEPTIPYLQTDPDSLTGRDATLYEYLKDTFQVTLVTVYVQRCNEERMGCVIGPAPTVPSTTCSKIKIIAPFHGFREPYIVHSRTVPNRQEFATLYTAMHIMLKTTA